MAKQSKLKQYTIQEILDYMDCPLCHHLKYIKGLPPSQDYLMDNPNVHYQEAVLETMRYYYTLHQQEKPPTLKALFDKYYTLWLEKTGTEDDGSILTRKLEHSTKHEREKRSKYITQGYDTLRSFYDLNAQTPQAILAINHPYTIKLGEMTVTGYIDVIREVEGHKENTRNIEILSMQLSKRKPDRSAIQTDLKLIAMALAFEQMFQVRPDAFKLHYVNREEIEPFIPDTGQYTRLVAIIDAFGKSVDTVDPYPRPGAHRFGSPYKELCDNYYL